MDVKEHLPGSTDRLGRTTTWLLVRFYVVPVLAGWLLAFVLATWMWMYAGVGIWAVAAVAAFLGAVLTIVMEEVVYDGQ